MSGNQFKEYIESHKLCKKTIAQSIGLTPQHFSNFLNGHIRELKKCKYYRLCNELGIEVLF